MARKREELILSKYILRSLIYDDLCIYDLDANDEEINLLEKELKNYTLIESNITSADEGDGGANYEITIERLSDHKFFGLCYSAWDLEYNFERDFPEELTEVFSKTKTIIIYE